MCRAPFVDRTWAEAAQCLAARVEGAAEAVNRSSAIVAHTPANATNGHRLVVAVATVIFLAGSMAGLALFASGIKSLSKALFGPLPRARVDCRSKVVRSHMTGG
jgi:hypothetical protein